MRHNVRAVCHSPPMLVGIWAPSFIRGRLHRRRYRHTAGPDSPPCLACDRPISHERMLPVVAAPLRLFAIHEGPADGQGELQEGAMQLHFA